MANLLTPQASRFALGERPGAGTTPAALAQFKLDRLLELRAIVDALRVDALGGASPRPERGDELMCEVAAAPRLLRS